MSEPPKRPPSAHPDVQGRCPSCRRSSLFLGAGGYVTCSHVDCPEPDAASTLLARTEPRMSAEQRTSALTVQQQIDLLLHRTARLSDRVSDLEAHGPRVVAPGSDRACSLCPGAPIIPAGQFAGHMALLHTESDVRRRSR